MVRSSGPAIDAHQRTRDAGSHGWRDPACRMPLRHARRRRRSPSLRPPRSVNAGHPQRFLSTHFTTPRARQKTRVEGADAPSWRARTMPQARPDDGSESPFAGNAMNRRRSPRRACAGELRWSLPGEAGTRHAWMTDASRGGLAFVTADASQLSSGEEILIRQRPTRRKLSAAITGAYAVCRVEPYDARLRLVACAARS